MVKGGGRRGGRGGAVARGSVSPEIRGLQHKLSAQEKATVVRVHENVRARYQGRGFGKVRSLYHLTG